jgi:predicted  nucleic acid-binding Zn-ribbon protein
VEASPTPHLAKPSREASESSFQQAKAAVEARVAEFNQSVQAIQSRIKAGWQ